jgi:hypothetical protein
MVLENLDPTVWGNHLWIFLHSMTLAYPNDPSAEDKIRIKVFIKSLSNVLPCEKCRLHFKKNLKKYPIDSALKTKETLIYWLYDIHNEVNKVTGKKKMTKQELIYYFNKLY